MKAPSARKERRNFSRGHFRLWLVLFALCLLGSGRALIDLVEFATLTTVPVVATATDKTTWAELTSVQRTAPKKMWDDLTSVQQAAAKKINPDEFIGNTFRDVGQTGLAIWAVWREHPRAGDLGYSGRWGFVPISDLSPTQLEGYRNFVAAERHEIRRGLVNFALIGLGVPLLIGCLGFLSVRVGRWVRPAW